MFNSNAKTDVFFGLKDNIDIIKSNIIKAAVSKRMVFI